MATPVSLAQTEEDSKVLNAYSTQFHSLAGALQYLIVTRPNLVYVVTKLCQPMHALATSYWSMLKRVLHYVKGTLDLVFILLSVVYGYLCFFFRIQIGLDIQMIENILVDL